MADTAPEIQPGIAQAARETSGAVMPDRDAGDAGGLPLALAGIDVAGQIRERSPGDSAIFGADSTRLIDRFVEPRIGQEMLARAAADGSAEAVASLITAAGQERFQISLWRQRAGDRIRLTVAFAGIRPTAAPSAADGALARLSQDLRSPLAAAMGFAEWIRQGCAGGGRGSDCAPETVSAHAASIIAAAWRIAGIADDLESVARGNGRGPSPRMEEVPVARVLRRVARLAEPAARTAKVAIEVEITDEADASVLGDDGMLWSVIDTLVHNAIRHAGPDATVRVSTGGDDGGLTVEIADTGPGMAPEELARAVRDGAPGRGFGFCRQLARANGADLEVRSEPGNGVCARLRFPPDRVLRLP